MSTHSGWLKPKSIGISAASELELRQSSLEPSECIKQIVSQLCFAGTLATRGAADLYVWGRFARLLDRLDEQGGSVRFLLFNPESEAFTRFSELRWSDGDTQSIERLQALSADDPCLEVRPYETLPSFRIMTIDESILTFPTPDDPGYRAGQFRQGATAHRAGPDRTLAAGPDFETLFEETWRTATLLDPPDGATQPF